MFITGESFCRNWAAEFAESTWAITCNIWTRGVVNTLCTFLFCQRETLFQMKWPCTFLLMCRDNWRFWFELCLSQEKVPATTEQLNLQQPPVLSHATSKHKVFCTIYVLFFVNGKFCFQVYMKQFMAFLTCNVAEFVTSYQ